ncbi:MAG: hypothetical protein HOE19_01950 [Candidatus Komeilibacteria bacterium]|jgi:hypothetical protein|nr:hypothetical protein [Candidatus Komeilibacteria bacterium]MBT4447457.1 hypothetical protein [Candidatus Komeilibacteria bacterium]
MYRLITKILFVAFLFILLPQIAQAGFMDDIAYCTANGSCNFEDAAAGLNSLIKLLLGMMGAVALLFFVWGGLQWLTSGGSAERVNRGKQIMINTVFAIILAFGSYILVSFFVNDVLNVEDNFQIQEGPFTGCNEMPIFTDCGDNKQCGAGFPAPWEHLNNSCVYICEIHSVLLSGGTRGGKCVGVLLEGSEVVPGWDSSWCPATQTCAYPPPN